MRDYYIGPVGLGGTLPIGVVCRDGDEVPQTPDSAPTYSVYGPDDNLTSPLTTGTLSASDADSKTGYRTGSQSISENDGFEAGDLCWCLVEYEIGGTGYTDTLRFSVT